MNDESIAFLVSKTGWDLEYIYQLPVSVFYALVHELYYQKAIDDYREQCNYASLMATMVNLGTKKRVTIEEIVGQPPERRNMQDDKILSKGSIPQKIVLADGQEYELAPVTLNVLMLVEDKFDKSYFDLINSRRLSHIRYIVFLRLKAKYPEMTEEKVGELVTIDVLTEIAKLYGVE